MPGWWNARHAALRTQCLMGVWVGIPLLVPKRWRGARAVYWNSLENCRGVKATVSSNLTLSATLTYGDCSLEVEAPACEAGEASALLVFHPKHGLVV